MVSSMQPGTVAIAMGCPAIPCRKSVETCGNWSPSTSLEAWGRQPRLKQSSLAPDAEMETEAQLWEPGPLWLSNQGKQQVQRSIRFGQMRKILKGPLICCQRPRRFLKFLKCRTQTFLRHRKHRAPHPQFVQSNKHAKLVIYPLLQSKFRYHVNPFLERMGSPRFC